MKKTLVFLSSLSLALSSLAADSNNGKNAQKSSQNQSSAQVNISDVSYILGYEIGKRFEQQGVDINQKSFAQGLKAGQSGDKLKYSKEKIRAQMKAFQTKMMKKAEKKKEQEAKANQKQSQHYMKKIANQDGIKKLDSGVYYKIAEKGSNNQNKKSSAANQSDTPKMTDSVTFNFKGMVPNRDQNKVFANTYKKNEPVEAQVKALIPCWQEALTHMHVGEKWTLYCSAEKGYGKQAPKVIGPNQALKFNIRLLDFSKAADVEEEVVVEKETMTVEEPSSKSDQSASNNQSGQKQTSDTQKSQSQ